MPYLKTFSFSKSITMKSNSNSNIPTIQYSEKLAGINPTIAYKEGPGGYDISQEDLMDAKILFEAAGVKCELCYVSMKANIAPGLMFVIHDGFAKAQKAAAASENPKMRLTLRLITEGKRLNDFSA